MDLKWTLLRSRAHESRAGVLLAATGDRSSLLPSPAKRIRRRRGIGLPGEGVVFDSIYHGNFWDQRTRRSAFSLIKTFFFDGLSEVFNRDIPSVLDLSCRFLEGPHLVDWRHTTDASKAWITDWKYDPLLRAGLTIRLLDLGSPDETCRGYLKLRGAINSAGRKERGFDIDRTYRLPGWLQLRHSARLGKYPLWSVFDTRTYGEVLVRDVVPAGSTKPGIWSIRSSAGVEQAVRLAGRFLVRARLGVTLRPDGASTPIIDLK